MSTGSLLFAGCSCSQQKTSEISTNLATTNPNTIQVQQSTSETKPKEMEILSGFAGTPQTVVNRMLELAQVGKDDIVYDLGSGDGRVPITAAKKFGARGIGVEIDPELIKKANENAKNSRVTDKVKFLQQDIFKSDFRDATVVFLALVEKDGIKLRPQLFKQLKPGTRVVAFQHHLGDWVDYDHVELAKCNPEDNCSSEDKQSLIYMWTIPKNVPENLQATSSNNRQCQN